MALISEGLFGFRRQTKARQYADPHLATALALALCYVNGHTTLEHLKDNYRRVHYLDGVVSYATRNHYFTWIMQSAISEGFVERMGPDEPAFPFTGQVDMRPSYMTTNRHLFQDLMGRSFWRPSYRP